MGHPPLGLISSTPWNQRYTRLTQLVVGKYPADSPDSRRCSYDAIQGNLPYLNKGHSLGRGVDYEVVEYVLISIHEKRV